MSPPTRTGRQRRGPTSVAGLAVAIAILLVGLSPAPAHAHAVLVETTPVDRSVLDAPPDAVTLRFNEPVELPPGALRVFDADAQRADDGPITTDDPAVVAVGLLSDLPDGGYVVTWRVVSADSHPVSGAFTFTVGDGAEVDPTLVAELFGGGTDRTLSTLGSTLRAVGYAGSLLAVGALVFALLVAASAVDRTRARRLALPAAAGAAVATLLAVPVQAMAVTGSGLLEALTPPGGLGATLTSSFGQATIVRLAGLALLAAGWRRGARTTLPVAGGTLALASHLLDGHQRTAEPVWLVAAGDAVHVAAAAVWFGGLVVLGWVLRARSLDDDPVGAARTVARFSRVALWSVAAIAVSGGAMAWALVRVPRALTDTAYGQLLVAKVALVAVAVAVAGYNRVRLVPAVAARLAPAGGSVDTSEGADERTERRSRAAWSQLRRTVAFEAGALAAVLAVTGFLVVQQPAAAELGVTGVYHTTAELTDEFDLDLVVDPNRVGRNAIHLYVLDATGRPAATVDDVRLELTYAPENIGPFVVEPFFAGPGHWVANVDDLRFAGEWHLRVVVGVDRFEDASVTVPVVVGR